MWDLTSHYMESTLVTLKVGQGDPNTNSSRDLGIKNPHTKLGDVGSIISEVIAFTR